MHDWSRGDAQARTKRMQATARMASVVPLTPPARRRLIRDVRKKFTIMPKIPVHSLSITNANLLTVQVGTNCPQGGNYSHGGRTVFRIIDDGATSLRLRIDGKEEKRPAKVELIFSGDSEAESFVEALEFAARVLRGQLEISNATEEDVA